MARRGRGSTRMVVVMVLAAAGCQRGAEAPRPAAPTPSDAGVATPASVPADAAPVLWDGICADNPLARGCM